MPGVDTDCLCGHQDWLTGYFLSTVGNFQLCIVLDPEKDAFLPSSDMTKGWAEFPRPSL